MDFDVTFFMQFGILMVLMLVLERLLHRPLLQVLEARERATTGTFETARVLEKRVAVERARYDARMAEARHRAHAEREALRQQGREQARRIEGAARQQMTNARLRARAEAEAMERRAEASLVEASGRWRQQLVDLALGRANRKAS